VQEQATKVSSEGLNERKKSEVKVLAPGRKRKRNN